MTETLVTLLSPSWLQRRVNIYLLDLHRRGRRSQFQCASHDLPSIHIIKERVVLIRSCPASLPSLAPAPLLRGRCPRLALSRVLFDALVDVDGGHCDDSRFQPTAFDLVGR